MRKFSYKNTAGLETTLTLDSILSAENKVDWDNQYLHEWAEYCDIGDIWEDDTQLIKRIE